MKIAMLEGWNSEQKNVVIASFLGWTLDAFDFFLMVFVLRDIADEFHASYGVVAVAVTLTLAARPIGAFLFGRLADRYGRRPALMADILLYSLLEFASGLAPSLTVLLVLRTLFGVAMGGEWGVGASLTMETIPPNARGIVSGFLQCGYPAGYLIASIVYGALFPIIGWRGMFVVGALPALLVLYIRRSVRETPGWRANHTHGASPSMSFYLGGALAYALILVGQLALFTDLLDGIGLSTAAAITMLAVGIFAVPFTFGVKHVRIAIYVILLMTGFNFFSHGTQDLYPLFLQTQHQFTPAVVGAIAVIYNIGAILGGLTFGAWSERIGRRRAVVIASLLSLPIIPLWLLGGGPVWLAVGAFAMQFVVQGAWGVIPAYLNELSPDSLRATFPGTTYQLGNLLASTNAVIQTTLAADHGNDFRIALGLVVGVVAVVIAVMAGLGFERRGIPLAYGTIPE